MPNYTGLHGVGTEAHSVLFLHGAPTVFLFVDALALIAQFFNMILAIGLIQGTYL